MFRVSEPPLPPFPSPPPPSPTHTKTKQQQQHWNYVSNIINVKNKDTITASGASIVSSEHV